MKGFNTFHRIRCLRVTQAKVKANEGRCFSFLLLEKQTNKKIPGKLHQESKPNQTKKKKGWGKKGTAAKIFKLNCYGHCDIFPIQTTYW